jgi:hypothetical protein
MIRQFLCAAALAVISLTAASAQDASDEPGGFSPAHTHPTSTFI